MRKRYLLPNLITTANMGCGFYAMTATIQNDFLAASWAIVAAGIFDMLDGRVARLTKTTSHFGVEYDSLSDLLSFGVAPGLLFYQWALSAYSKPGWCAALLFIACGALRLARFNVNHNELPKGYFQGLPITMAAQVISTFVIFIYAIGWNQISPFIAFGLIGLMAVLMVSSVRFPSYKEVHFQSKKALASIALACLILASIAIKPTFALFLTLTLYIVMSLIWNILQIFNRRPSSTPLLYILILVGISSSTTSQAILYVTPDSASGTRAGRSAGGATFYYYVKTGTIADPDTGLPNLGVPADPAFINFTPLDVYRDADADAAAGQALANQFIVSLMTTNYLSATTGTQQYVIAAQLTPQTGGGTPIYAPIASVNGNACDDSRCQNKNLTTGRYYAARLGQNSGGRITLGFYGRTVCQDYALTPGSIAVPGCQRPVPYLIQPTQGNPTSFQMTFGIYTAADSGQTTPPSGNAIDSLSAPIIFNLQVDTPTALNCPSTTQLGNQYTPIDHKIQFITLGFSMTLSSNGDAPFQNLIALGQENAHPGIHADDYQTNPIQSTLTANLSTPQEIGELLNSVETTHPYYFSFLGQDAAGIMVRPDSVSHCELGPVTTSEIRGALPRDKRCFIATAAFHSTEAKPVILLRQFRDQVLLQSKWGQRSVAWYYDWSPTLANWVLDHPVFRIPVLCFLIPFEMIAWTLLHPPLTFLLLGFGLTLILLGVRWKLLHQKSTP